MQSVILELPDEIAQQLRSYEADAPRIIELGLQEWVASEQPGFEGATELMEFLANLPSPEEMIALRPTTTMQSRIHHLLEKNRDNGLTHAEEREWEQYQYLEHLVRVAKAKAYLKLNQS